MKNILITGIPRSGTSLLTKLLSQQENVLCFSEPSWLKDIRYPEQTAEEFSNALKDKINHIRKDIKYGNPVTITVKKGTKDLPDNYFKKSDQGQINLKQDKEIFVEYSENLVIVIKSNTLFTACLTELIKQQGWEIFAIVRDPLYTLLSWRSLDIPISRGEIKIGEIYSEEVREIVNESDILKRQVLILNWFMAQFKTNKCQYIKYENLINNPNLTLNKILNNQNDVGLQLKSGNVFKNYNDPGLMKIQKYLDEYLAYSY